MNSASMLMLFQLAIACNFFVCCVFCFAVCKLCKWFVYLCIITFFSVYIENLSISNWCLLLKDKQVCRSRLAIAFWRQGHHSFQSFSAHWLIYIYLCEIMMIVFYHLFGDSWRVDINIYMDGWFVVAHLRQTRVFRFDKNDSLRSCARTLHQPDTQ